MIRATYAELPATDLDRAATFYREVFGCEVERTIIDGHPAAILDPDDGDAAGATIALMQGESYVPSVEGTRIYVTVAHVEETLAKVSQNGGAILYPATTVLDGMTVAEFRDSEGNRIALSDR